MGEIHRFLPKVPIDVGTRKIQSRSLIIPRRWFRDCPSPSWDLGRYPAQDWVAAAGGATPICYERVSTRAESATQGQIFSIDAKNTVFTPLFALTTTAKLAAKEAG
jgi:hypothetical protein